MADKPVVGEDPPQVFMTVKMIPNKSKARARTVRAGPDPVRSPLRETLSSGANTLNAAAGCARAKAGATRREPASFHLRSPKPRADSPKSSSPPAQVDQSPKRSAGSVAQQRAVASVAFSSTTSVDSPRASVRLDDLARERAMSALFSCSSFTAMPYRRMVLVRLILFLQLNDA